LIIEKSFKKSVPFSKMGDSERTLSDEEFNPEQEEEPEEYDSEEWEDVIDPDESVSQVSHTRTTSETGASDIPDTLESAVWLHFDKNPPSAPGYNVCKICKNKYKVTTSVSTLRKHLKKHQLSAPTKNQSVTKKIEPFNDKEQKIHDKYLIDWLICDLQPFTIVENHYFRELVNFFCSRYIIPDRHKVKGN
jgi:hypothetical protein